MLGCVFTFCFRFGRFGVGCHDHESGESVFVHVGRFWDQDCDIPCGLHKRLIRYDDHHWIPNHPLFLRGGLRLSGSTEIRMRERGNHWLTEWCLWLWSLDSQPRNGKQCVYRCILMCGFNVLHSSSMPSDSVIIPLCDHWWTHLRRTNLFLQYLFFNIFNPWRL